MLDAWLPDRCVELLVRMNLSSMAYKARGGKMKFSERYGYAQVKQTIQFESMNQYLRTGLWNVLTVHLWCKRKSYSPTLEHNLLYKITSRIWAIHFKRRVDDLSLSWVNIMGDIDSFFFHCSWNEVYDLIEFISQNYEWDDKVQFVDHCNEVLKRELSGWRLVNDEIAPITESHELDAIQQAIDKSAESVRMHLQSALELLANRTAPDYRNSIKESISAVESLVGKALGEEGTLGNMLKKMETQFGLHPCLKDAFSKLYGYTSDADGIRHASYEITEFCQEDAIFFLVTCSAFVNYVQAKFSMNS